MKNSNLQIDLLLFSAIGNSDQLNMFNN